jgi:AcrR family transcriptional regulator
MDDAGTPTPRIGRPPKIDADGIPTRDRLLRAAVDACVEHGYDGATLADIARRAGVSTPAIYGHFDGKAALLVEASKHALDAISPTRLPGEAGVREIARAWLDPAFAPTRILVAELHCAAIRQPEVRELLAAWQAENAEQLMLLAGISPAQVSAYYMLLIGLSHVDEVAGVDVDVSDVAHQVDALIDGWFTASASQADCYSRVSERPFTNR